MTKSRKIRKGQTRRELERRLAEIRESMASSCTPLPPNEREERLARARDDVLYFGKTYLPHYFQVESAPFHRDLVELLNLRDRPVAVAAARSHGKSTLVALAYPLHQLAFRLRHFIVLISETEDQAADATEFIKLELEENPRLRQDFGIRRREGSGERGDFATTTETRVLARGRRQRVRSARYRQWRPDLIVVDDVESDESVRNPRTIKRVYDWLRGEVYGTMDTGCSFFIIGNLLAKRSVMGNLLFDEDLDGVVERRIYRAIDPATGEPLWPARWPLSELAAKKRFMGSVLFEKEYNCNPQNPDGNFQDEWIRYYDPGEIAGRRLDVYSFEDPVTGEGKSSEFHAIVTVGLDRQNMVYYVLDAFIRRVSIDALLHKSWQTYDDYHPTLFGLEINGFQVLLQRDYERMARERGYYLPLKLVLHRSNKEARIVSTLQYIVEHGKLRFHRGHTDQDVLVEQLVFLDEPSVADDGPDALEGAVSLASTGGRCPSIRSRSVRRADVILEGY
ncbi:MAG TPA: hypothetical protein VMW93_04495 [bacterium]|nr:hypothetical protein [bacterium]